MAVSDNILWNNIYKIKTQAYLGRVGEAALPSALFKPKTYDNRTCRPFENIKMYNERNSVSNNNKVNKKWTIRN